MMSALVVGPRPARESDPDGRGVLSLAAVLLAGTIAASCGGGETSCTDCTDAGAGGHTTTTSASGGGGDGGGTTGPCETDEDCGSFKCCDEVCTNTDSDPYHCGGCGAECGSPLNGTAECSKGQCTVSCWNGYSNCNLLTSDGCEVDTTTDPANCSGCGAACLYANGDPGCAEGQCVLASCHAGFADCDDDPTNGCETDLANDAANCTSCGNVCDAPPNVVATCVGGVCGDGQCVLGFADCNGDLTTDGCETDLFTDVNNCGACGAVCSPLYSATVECSNGGCAVAACDGGYADCDSSVYDGCEVDLASDINNCSACGYKCPAVANGAPACVTGSCGVGSCDGGHADCDGNPSNGCEVHLANNTDNCGACGVTCAAVDNGTPLCSGFVCGLGGCDPGFADCFGGAANGCETDLTSDVNHCGTCTTACPVVQNGTRSCVTGTCGIGTCSPGYEDCDGQLNNGCETVLATSLDNCGGCGNVCQTPNHGVAGCANGSCKLASCNPGFSDCDNNPANGCEKNTSNDPTNCGGCGIVCGSGQCASSACTGCIKKVLLIADDSQSGAATLAAALAGGQVCSVGSTCVTGPCQANGTCPAGYTVTQTTVPSYQYDGTNPALTGFGAVIVLAGGPGTTSYQTDMPTAGQQAITNFIEAGNGAVFTEWAAFQVDGSRWATLKTYVLLQRTKAYSGQVTYTVDAAFASSPLWAGLPASFTFASTSNVGITKVAPGVTRVAGSPQAIDAVAIRDTGKGRVVHVAHAGNYAPNGWTNTNMQKLVVNAVGWAARCP